MFLALPDDKDQQLRLGNVSSKEEEEIHVLSPFLDAIMSAFLSQKHFRICEKTRDWFIK
jgi:hypothetical protein